MNKVSDKKAILEAKNLSKTFSNESVQQHVLKNLNLNIYKGDFTVIMGNSGSGKSTLLYALSGMDRPSLGTICYYVEDDNKKFKSGTGDGIEISKFSNDKLALFRRNHAGFVFQQNYLNDSMSALDNVMVSGFLRNKDRASLNKALHFFGIIVIFAIGAGVGGILSNVLHAKTIWISMLLLTGVAVMMIKENR